MAHNNESNEQSDESYHEYHYRGACSLPRSAHASPLMLSDSREGKYTARRRQQLLEVSRPTTLVYRKVTSPRSTHHVRRVRHRTMHNELLAARPKRRSFGGGTATSCPPQSDSTGWASSTPGQYPQVILRPNTQKSPDIILKINNIMIAEVGLVSTIPSSRTTKM